MRRSYAEKSSQHKDKPANDRPGGSKSFARQHNSTALPDHIVKSKDVRKDGNKTQQPEKADAQPRADIPADEGNDHNGQNNGEQQGSVRLKIIGDLPGGDIKLTTAPETFPQLQQQRGHYIDTKDRGSHFLPDMSLEQGHEQRQIGYGEHKVQNQTEQLR